MDGVIKAHCMGMEFPKRDTDSPNVKWEYRIDIPDSMKLLEEEFVRKYVTARTDWLSNFEDKMAREIAKNLHREIVASLPTAADLDAVAEEQRVKEKTSDPLSQDR